VPRSGGLGTIVRPSLVQAATSDIVAILTEPVTECKVFCHKNSVKYYLDHQPAKSRDFHISFEDLPRWRCSNRQHVATAARNHIHPRPEAASLGFG